MEFQEVSLKLRSKELEILKKQYQSWKEREVQD